jgi:hypothetical protein
MSRKTAAAPVRAAEPRRERPAEPSGSIIAAVRPYVSIDQLAALTPWTAQAIRTMMTRGVFKLGVHYFKPQGPGGRPIFQWRAVEAYIEGRGAKVRGNVIELADGRSIDIDEATRQAAKLLG